MDYIYNHKYSQKVKQSFLWVGFGFIVDALKCIRWNKNKASSSPKIMTTLKMKTSECFNKSCFPSACPESRYGKDCAQFCACGKGQCDPRTGECTCAPGHAGPACQQGNKAEPRSPCQWVIHFKSPANKLSAKHCS